MGIGERGDRATSDMRAPDPLKINARYDTLLFSPRHHDFAEGWANFGYWDSDTSSQKRASENLMEKLLAYIPMKRGTLLDVACGKGLTTHYLANYYRPSELTGINISELQLASARELVPGATFLLMDAVELRFPDASFDDVICVEAAFHFDTREAFFREALRVLTPGGHLVLADVLMTREGARRRPVCTEKNHLDDLAEYAELMRHVGFEGVEVVDVTKECWHGHFRHMIAYAHEKLLMGDASFAEMQQSLAATYERVPDITYYLLAAGRKPRHGRVVGA